MVVLYKETGVFGSCNRYLDISEYLYHIELIMSVNWVFNPKQIWCARITATNDFMLKCWFSVYVRDENYDLRFMYYAAVILKNYGSIWKATRGVKKWAPSSVLSAGTQFHRFSPTYVRSGATYIEHDYVSAKRLTFNSHETEIFPKRASGFPPEDWYILRRNRGRQSKRHVRGVASVTKIKCISRERKHVITN